MPPQATALPQLPRIEDALRPRPSGEYNYSDIFNLLKTPQGRLTDVLPQVQDMLGAQSEFIRPAVAQIREGARSDAASAQSDAMRRGLTGSDIELANIRGAREQGENRVAQILGQVGMQQSASMAQYIMQAAGMDIQANREMFVTLAQAIGEKLASDKEDYWNRLFLQEGMAEAARRRGGAFGGGLGSLVGTIGAGGLGYAFGGPLGGLLGGMLGGQTGQAFGTGIGGR